MKMRAGVVAVALLAGCGGETADKDASPTATKEASSGNTISAAEWSKRVEAICAETEAKTFEQGKELGRKSAAAGDSKQELTYKVLQLESKLVDPLMDRVEALPKPKGREQDADEFVAGMRNVGDLLGQTATAIKRNDEANGRKLVKELQTKVFTARRQARALNIEKCNPSPNEAGSSG
jgi:hypothetical protein